MTVHVHIHDVDVNINPDPELAIEPANFGSLPLGEPDQEAPRGAMPNAGRPADTAVTPAGKTPRPDPGSESTSSCNHDVFSDTDSDIHGSISNFFWCLPTATNLTIIIKFI